MRITFLVLALHLFLASYGASSDAQTLTTEGESALGTRDWAPAAGRFDEALLSIGTETAHPMYLRAQLDKAEVLGRSNPTESQAILSNLQKELPGQADLEDWIPVMNAMAASSLENAGDITQATLEQARIIFSEDQSLLGELKDMLMKKSLESGNEEPVNPLGSLGYIGAGDE
jgi:hypothetical protein